MTKRIKIIVSHTAKANDKQYVEQTIDSIIDALHDFTNTVTHLFIDKDKDNLYVSFNLKVSNLGDLCWMLIKEYLSCLRQTEDKIDISIDEVEEDGTGTIYKFYKYIPNEEVR